MGLVIQSGDWNAIEEWKFLFAEFLPDLHGSPWESKQIDISGIHYPLVWKPTTGRLVQFLSLGVIMSSAIHRPARHACFLRDLIE
ncbi:hypothetical protein [Caballeronia sp. DA-9]|uniref:hypothetical protein n=1 Tax=Caballeronia sp. DA-9 TaxID=3436237 RepID=UPI003F666F93